MKNNSQMAADQALKIRFEQVKQLYAPTRYVVVGTAIVVIMLAVIQWSLIDHTVILSWLTVMGLVIASRLLLVFSFEKKAQDWHDVKQWEKSFLISVVMGGIVWGSASLLLFPAGNVEHQAFLFMIIAGMVAASTTTLSPLKSTGISYILLTTLPLFFRLIFESTNMSIAFAVLVMVFMLMMLNSSVRNYKNYLQSITLRFEAEEREKAMLTAGEKLLKSEAKYRGIFDESVAVIYVFDQQKNFLDSNQAGLDLLGYSKEELLGMNIDDVDADQGTVVPAHKHLLSGDRIVNFEHRLVHKDGHIITVLNNSRPLFNETDKVIGMQSTLIDISEREEAVHDLAWVNNHLQALYDSSPDMVFIHGPDGLLIDVNDNVLKTFCYTKEEFLALDMRTFIGEEFSPELAFEYMKRTMGGEDMDFDWISKKSNGEEFPVEVRLRKIGDTPNLLALVRDITEQRAAEDIIKQAVSKLNEAQTIAHIGNWDLDLLTSELIWSDEIYRIFEINKEQFDASYDAFLAAIHPDDREAVERAYNDSVKNRVPYDITHRLLFDDGRVKYVHEHCNTFYDDQGTPIRSTGTIQDISEYKKLEEQLLQSQKMEAIGTLVGGIAHDFNNILAAVQGNLFLLKMQLEDHPIASTKLDNIEKLSFRASEMVQQLLTFARKDMVQMKPLLLNSFLKEEVKLTRSVIPENIERQFDICNDPLLVKGDATQLQQALMNLMNNSCHALIGVSRPKIKCSLEPWTGDKAFYKRHPELECTEFALITVQDNGAGIAAAELEKIFEPFFTTKEVGEGTGLGLAMVYGAVQNHGGIIEVESILEEGTVFRIYLPLIGSGKDSANIEDTASKIIRGSAETILLVDDEEDMLNAIAEVLESLGYQVVTAVDGEDAVLKFRMLPEEIDLVILDIVMPKMGGMDAANLIREINGNIPIIFATGYDKERVRGDEDTLENSILLDKPFPIGKLSSTLRELIEQR